MAETYLPDAVPLDQVRRALVIKLRHHGDVLLASPVFSALKAAAPHIEIDALVYADTAEMLTLHPAICQVHGIDRKWKKLGPLGHLKAEWQLLQTLRHPGYDLVIHLTDHPRGAWLARAVGARWAVAPKVKGRGGFWQKSFTHFISYPGVALRHTVERNLDALRRIGLYPRADERNLALVPGAAAETRVEQLLAGHGLTDKPFVHVHPASRWRFKCWTNEGMAAVIAGLQRAGWPVVVTAASDGAERAMVDAIGHLLSEPVVDLSGQLSLKELAALAGRARLFLGVDSAPMHIAAAMGTPVVVLFGPSGDKEWGPWGVPCRIVASQTHSCRPCGLDGCGGSKVSDCLETLPAERVLADCLDLLQ
ncbi:putative lipopolysaccharide heptosyltransferase III [Azospira oryzae]|jgi:heptosyltransferase-3|uniref:putative lipopolysaccharide heptosyltransferase III n=1 Tax=Azospira oryzae TaxID=146939 RepID=UPI001965F43C|nr:putative lipopolysaccharide heptosyltransferase III [Azospira oryzae]